ncbi:MAG: hypothetical protein ACFFER_12345 [Candidatus Thorarchaeota archaeon]
MSDFSKALRLFLFDVLVRSGKSVLDRDFRGTLQWDEDDEFRDDDDIDRVEAGIRKAAHDLIDQMMAKISAEGFETENDFVTRKEELSSLLEEFLSAFESELREGEM